MRYDIKRFTSWGQKQAQATAGTTQQTFDLRITVSNPAGKVTDVEIASLGVRSGERSTTAQRSFVLCAGPGWYTADVTGWWCPGLRVAQASSTGCLNVAFSKRFLLQATNNRVSLKRHGGGIRVRGSKALYVVIATTRHRGSTESLRGVRVAIQRKVGSQWLTVKAGVTDSRGRFTSKVTYRYAGKQVFRASLGSTAAVSSAVSKTRPVRVNPPRPKKIKRPTPSPTSFSGGGSTSNYNGPRCYSPGGLTWRPC